MADFLAAICTLVLTVWKTFSAFGLITRLLKDPPEQLTLEQDPPSKFDE